MVFHDTGEAMNVLIMANTEQARTSSALSSGKIELISSKEPIFIEGEGDGDSVPVATA